MVLDQNIILIIMVIGMAQVLRIFTIVTLRNKISDAYIYMHCQTLNFEWLTEPTLNNCVAD